EAPRQRLECEPLVLERHLRAPAVGREAPVVLRRRQVVELDGHVVRNPVRALRCYRRTRGAACMKKALNNEQLEPLIFTIRGRRVLLDMDLARLYGVTVGALNQAVKRNSDRF